MASQPDLVEVISRIAVGDESALAELYDATSPLLFGLILRVLGDRAVAEEVLLEVYWQLWREASTYSPDRHTPLSWLVTRARRRALDRLGLSPSSQPGSKPPDSTNLAFAAEKQRLVRSALNDLREEERQVCCLSSLPFTTRS
jgi:RNA polymerase sigma-70 factor (ECF subfamily)